MNIEMYLLAANIVVFAGLAAYVAFLAKGSASLARRLTRLEARCGEKAD